MTPNKPYLIRAFNEWILDNELTPYLVVDATYKGVYVPANYINKDGQIVFNITPGIVAKLMLGNEVIEFDARFGGLLQHIYIPIGGVLAIYAKENGQGMVFEKEPELEQDNAPTDLPPPKSGGKGKPNLRIVK